MADGDDRRVELSGAQASGKDADASSLMPMLVAGLVLIVVGAIVIMTFV